ncbi:MAG: trimethylamine methyltransferase family protein [Alphaproteobacteria bacterium]|nr:trimethylamine methyltransferase family protein [Alphaproteobacteria bacterium]
MPGAKTVAQRTRRSGGRSGRQQSDLSTVRNTSHYRRLRNPFGPIEILSADEVEAIHQASLTILEEIGIKVLHAAARGVYQRAGALVDPETHIVRIGGDLIETFMASVPPTVSLHCRNLERSLELGGRNIAVAAVGGPPNVSDRERGRRPGTGKDFRDLVRMAQSFDIVHLLSPSVEPLDVELRFRHLEVTRAQSVLSDKFPFVFARGVGQTADALEIVRIAQQASPEDFASEARCYTVINANSPLQLDVPMCQGIIDFANAGQLMVLTPFTLAGAMAPVTIAGALAQQNAEALAGLCLSQMVNPGAPVCYGGFTSNVDMKSGAPAFGTPEYVKAALASGQLCRRYNVPYRSSNVNASNTPDAQAAYESQMAIWSTLMGGCNLLMHGAGWLEGGLTASFEKFVMDVDMLQMMAEVFTGLPVDTKELALDAIREVGQGGHFFGAAHTLDRYSSAFYEPIVSDWRNYETWDEAGRPDAYERAHSVYKQTLEAFEPPPIEQAVLEEIDSFVERRTAEGGALPES